MSIEKNKPYSKAEAAEALGVHQNSLYNWEKQGIIHPQRLGRRVFIMGNELLRALGVES